MSAAGASSTQSAAEDFTGIWRHQGGLFLIVVGRLVLLAGLLVPFIGAGQKTARPAGGYQGSKD